MAGPSCGNERATVSDSAEIDANEDAAARWAIRLDGEPLSDSEQVELDLWLAGEPRRRGALLRAEAALAYLDRGRALPEDALAAPQDAPRIGRRGFLIGGSLSGLAAAGVLGFLFVNRTTPVEIRTALGEVRRVPLADGSVASVNTDSKVEVSLHRDRRDVRLDSGEAWFQVAHDKTRPFVVAAGDVRVQAVGTAFSVRKLQSGAEVRVTEGIVDVWIEGQGGKPIRVAAGSRALIGGARPISVEVSDDINRELAWRTGELALNGETLAYAANELNRYNKRKIVIADPALGREPLIGYFRTDQPAEFGQAMGKLLGAKVTVDDDSVTLSR